MSRAWTALARPSLTHLQPYFSSPHVSTSPYDTLIYSFPNATSSSPPSDVSHSVSPPSHHPMVTRSKNSHFSSPHMSTSTSDTLISSIPNATPSSPPSDVSYSVSPPSVIPWLPDQKITLVSPHFSQMELLNIPYLMP
jgi:hypothetical protein